MKHKSLRVWFVLVLIVFSSCSSPTESQVAATATQPATNVPSETATLPPTETLQPSPTPPPVIGPGNLNQVEALHNFQDDVDGTVTSVAYSPDGRFVAVGGCQVDDPYDLVGSLSCRTFDDTDESFLVILDAKTGSPVTSVPVEGRINRIAFTHAGNKLVYANIVSGEIVVWDIASANVEIVLEEIGSFGQAGQIAISPDDHWMAIKFISDESNGSGNVTIWDLSTGELATEVPIKALKSILGVVSIPPDITRHRAKGWEPDFSADSQRLLIPEDDEFVIYSYDTITWQEVGRFQSPCSNKCNIAVSPDYSMLVILEAEETFEFISGELDQKPPSVTVWDLTTGEQVRSIGEGLDFPVPLTFTPDGQFLFGVNGFVWDIAGLNGIGWDVANEWKLINTLQINTIQDIPQEIVLDVFYDYRKFADDGRTYLEWKYDGIVLYGLP